MSRIEQADKERRNIEAGAPPERTSKNFIIFQQSQQIAELLDWSHKALKHLPQAYWDSLKEITEKHKVK